MDCLPFRIQNNKTYCSHCLKKLVWGERVHFTFDDEGVFQDCFCNACFHHDLTLMTAEEVSLRRSKENN